MGLDSIPLAFSLHLELVKVHPGWQKLGTGQPWDKALECSQSNHNDDCCLAFLVVGTSLLRFAPV